MSTTGKVFVVLVAIAIIPWIILFSMISQLNTNWGQHVAKLEASIQQEKDEAVKASESLAEMRVKINASQVRRDQELSSLRGLISQAEKRLTVAEERQERLRIDLETYMSVKAKADALIETRMKEKQETEKTLADTQAAVAALQADVVTKLAEVANLRQKFLNTMEQNRSELERRKQAEPAGAHTRPASYRR